MCSEYAYKCGGGILCRDRMRVGVGVSTLQGVSYLTSKSESKSRRWQIYLARLGICPIHRMLSVVLALLGSPRGRRGNLYRNQLPVADASNTSTDL